MLGLIQDRQLLISGALSHAARFHGGTPVISRRRDGSFHRSTWEETDGRVRQLADALRRRGFGIGDRIATLAWNNYRHLEVYLAATAIGAICHPINPRLFHEQAIYITRHAEDRALFFDTEYLPLAELLAANWNGLSLLVHMEGDTPDAGPAGTLAFEALLAEGDADFAYPDFDEHLGASLCYTSGTTGNPKGVLSTHRAIVLHAMAARTADLFALTPQSTACAIVPLYHAHAGWGLAFAAAMSGSALVLPGLALDGAGLVETFRETGVTVANGVPTIWQGVVGHLDAASTPLALRRIVVAGSAPPPSLVEKLELRHGITLCHIWGMTETGPCATSGAPPAWAGDLDEASLNVLKAKQGHGMYGVEMRIADDNGAELPWGESSLGQLQVRGPFVVSGYFKGEGADAVDAEGWFATGDIASIDAHGYMRLVDRAKDLVKSGGEWISSIDVENAAMAHPHVREAAVIAVPHETWVERPLLFVVLHEDCARDEASIRACLAERLAKWWLPDTILFVPELPRTGTGKIMKAELRKSYADRKDRVA